MRFALLLVEKFFGKLPTSTGANVSLEPPVMEPRFAQLTAEIKPIIATINIPFFNIHSNFVTQNNNYIYFIRNILRKI